MTLWDSIILAVVEGLTEYLPISSTGHIIVTSSMLGIQEEPFTKNFTVIVQFGAILSVLVMYSRRFKTSLEFYKKLLVGFLPAAVIGFVVKNKIDALLDSVEIVATSFIVGGFLLIWLEKILQKREVHNIDRLPYKNSALIGLSQCIAFIPGVSRSGASILGGMWQGLNRKDAAEFSFFLAVPTLAAATLYKSLKILPTITVDQTMYLLVGNVVSFIVGCVTIKYFIRYLTSHSFFVFGVYRIIFGGVIWLLLLTGHNLKII